MTVIRNSPVRVCLQATLVSVALGLYAFPAEAKSLWTPNAESLYADIRAHQIGDVVTVLVTENQKSSNKNDNTREKEMTVGGKVAGANTPAAGDKTDDHWWYRIARKIPLFGAEITGKSELERKNNTKNESLLSLAIAAQVVNVMPNGNLVVHGRKSLIVSNDRIILQVSGIIRPFDISKDNSVRSSQLADAHISYTPEFTVNAKKRKTLTDRIFGPVVDVLF
ncbi:flagellar basal body L-ring protein FlgH [bacterium]|nr:flagellar basal body L-ring protein FlgH [bacterium]